MRKCRKVSLPQTHTERLIPADRRCPCLHTYTSKTHPMHPVDPSTFFLQNIPQTNTIGNKQNKNVLIYKHLYLHYVIIKIII